MRKTCLYFLVSLAVLSSNVPCHAATEDPPRNTGRKWAICVGVNKYKDPLIPALSTAVNDAKGLAAAMEEYGGFDEVVVLTDEVGEKNPLFPSMRHVQELLFRLAPRIKPQDILLFSFSGNGFTDETGRAFLLAPDSRISHLEETAIPMDAVLDLLKRTGAKRRVLLIDAAREMNGDLRAGVYPDRYMKKEVTAVFYAAAKGHSSHEDERSRHTIFAKNLIQGLEGGADRRFGGNRDGIVTLSELSSYVELSFEEWRIKTIGRQAPFIEITDNGHADMMISSAEKVRTAKPSPSTPLVDIASGKKESEESPSKQVQTRRKKDSGPKIGPPAPKIDDLVKDAGAKAAMTRETGAVSSEAKSPSVNKEPVKEDVKIVFKERTPDGETRHSSPPAKDQPAREQIGTAVAQTKQEPVAHPLHETANKPAPEKIAYSPEAKRPAVRLRAKPKDVSVEEIKSILTSYGFYSTCWNYNADFCRSERSFQNQFQENGDGTVSDRATGLMWQKGGSRDGMTWSAAREYVERVNKERFAGHTDWRIPTIEELASLIQSAWKNGDLFNDPVFDRTQRQCWSMDAKGVDAAWKANFHQGLIMDFPVDSPSAVRLVRSLK